MSNWSIIPTKSLIESENLINDIIDCDDHRKKYVMCAEVKRLIRKAMLCNVKPEGVK